LENIDQTPNNKLIWLSFIELKKLYKIYFVIYFIRKLKLKFKWNFSHLYEKYIGKYKNLFIQKETYIQVFLRIMLFWFYFSYIVSIFITF
jgi:hypothetical protein